MLRLSLLLGASVYAALIILSETLPTPVVDSGPQAAGPEGAEPARASAPDLLVTEDGRRLPVAAVIAPARVAPDVAVAMVSTRPAGTAVAREIPAAAPERPLVAVTGRQVNLRAGPSTEAAVLASLVQGAEAELIGADGTGWVLIRAVETGIEGYMSDQFVAVVN